MEHMSSNKNLSKSWLSNVPSKILKIFSYIDIYCYVIYVSERVATYHPNTQQLKLE
jgi:hypothetical protein